MRFKRKDKVKGWFGTGVVTDVANDDLIRIIQKQGHHGEVSYRWVMASTAELIEEAPNDSRDGADPI